jgi:hypothetical protein
MFENWQGMAFNQVPDSQNQIHGDKVAQAYGFKGGLVPGVTVSAYLIHPAVTTFGLEYLTRGSAHVRVNSPLYDGEEFSVGIVDQNDTSYSAHLLRSDGTPLAEATVDIGIDIGDPPQMRGDEQLDLQLDVPVATPENMLKLMMDGCKAYRVRWDKSHPMSRYLTDPAQMAELLQFGDKAGFANPSFVLGVSNWVLAGNAQMNPWVHMETRSQNYAAIPPGSVILAEMSMVDLFSKKGHEFVDVEVNLFDESTRQCYAAIQLRAIYRLRGL